MKIFLPFKARDIGGTASFAAKFKLGMEKRGHQVFFDFQKDYDCLLLIAQAPLSYLINAKQNGKKIVQRLDGVYYYSVSGWKFPLFNAKATYIRHFFSDFTVYQSAYSKYCVEKFLAKKQAERSTVIYNGVDLHLFSPTGSKKKLRDFPTQKIFFTASDFRRRDQIVPIIDAFGYYRKKYDAKAKLIIAGSFRGEIVNLPDRYRSVRNIVFWGKIKNSDLPLYEKAADVFLHTHLNPPCPNGVIEAMACGLPICGVADGAMGELVKEGKNGLLVPTRGNAFWRRRAIDIREFADNLYKIIKDRERFARESRHIAEERFSLDRMISEYERILKELP